eukprot:m.76514 g.76514  ORF g.76514 m.76514 type:complete len:320 (+) comp14514_c0_seq3:1036-1995(+)
MLLLLASRSPTKTSVWSRCATFSKRRQGAALRSTSFRLPSSETCCWTRRLRTHTTLPGSSGLTQPRPSFGNAPKGGALQRTKMCCSLNAAVNSGCGKMPLKPAPCSSPAALTLSSGRCTITPWVVLSRLLSFAHSRHPALARCAATLIPSFHLCVQFMSEVLETIERENIPAPSPIEQRWTSASQSPLSPAYSEDPASLFSWVGVIMYLPTQDPEARRKLGDEFGRYQDKIWPLLPKYSAITHWAKVEVPSAAAGTDQAGADSDGTRLQALRDLYRARLGPQLGQLVKAQALLDPKRVCSSFPLFEHVLRPAATNPNTQ